MSEEMLESRFDVESYIKYILGKKNIHPPQQSYDYLHANSVTSERRMPCAGHYWRPEQELVISDTSIETSYYQSTCIKQHCIA